MESSARAFRRNLEPFEDESVVGPWHLAGYIDLVSERRYLLSWLPAEPATRVDATVLAFRCEAATTIAPAACPPAHDVVVADGRAEILTSYTRPIGAVALSDADVEVALRSLLEAIRTLEAHAFYASHLAPEFVRVDEHGIVTILPAAYAFPPEDGDPRQVAERAAVTHVRAVAALADQLAAHARAPLADRLRAFSSRVRSNDLRSVAGALTHLFDDPTPEPDRGPVRVPTFDPAALATAIGASQLVEISGSPASGRTATLAAVADYLSRTGVDVQWIDEWDTAVTRRRGSARDSSRASVWLVDDADTRPLLHALLLDHATGMESRPGAGLVTVTNGGGEGGSIAAQLRARSTRGVHTVTLPGQTPDRAKRVDPLDWLEPEAHQVLELVAVAAMPLPIDLVLSVYPAADRPVHRHIYALAGAGLLVVESRRVPPSTNASLVLRVPSASMRAAIYAGIPASRRRNLHRTVARIADERGTFPVMFVYEHLARAGEGAEAASRAATFVKESTRAQRAPFLDAIIATVVNGDLYRSLPYGDQMALLVRLGDDLLARGKQREAEAILTRARSLRPGIEDVHAHAPLVSEAMRLLADAWAARGQLREALELLEDTREDVAPHLSLAEQARLLNDIGWLQYRLGDYSSCVDSCKFTLNTINPNEHPLVVAQALNLMGVISFNTSRYDEAVSYYEQSAFLRERENDLNALAGSFNNLALAYQSKGEYDKALGYLHKSIEIKGRQNNEAGIAGGYLNLAFLYLEVHNFDEAERKCRESLRISSELGLAQLTAENLNTLGDIVFARGRLDDAEDYYRRSLESARRLSTVNEEMGAHKRLAKLFIRKGRHDDALTAVEDASRLAEKVGSRYEQAQTEDIFGDLRAAQGLHAESIDHFDKAATLYATLSKHRLASACLAKAGLGYARTGNPLDAKRSLDRAQDLIKSQIGHEIPEEIVTLQQTLRESPLPPAGSGTESQKLLYAFYELSSLSDYADHMGAFFRRIIAVFQELAGARQCTLAIHKGDKGFVSVDATGEESPVEDAVMQAIFARALQLGTVVHSGSPEIKDILAAAPPSDPDSRLVIVPMKSMGKDLGCVVLTVPPSAVPTSKDDLDFISCIGRHVAGDLRLSLHMDERSHKEETLVRDIDALGAQTADGRRFQNMIGRDESMQKVFRIVDKIKDMDTGILINGESGTGKTELARTIHNNSPRRRHVFQSIHCAEIPTSLLESELFGHERGAFTGAVQRKLGRCEVADNGTVFLDDVNVMPLETQSKLLHYLETKSFTRLGGTQKISTDVRIIAASNEDLEVLVKEGRFREDLFYRLKVIQIELPPLRDRQEDILLLAREFVKKRCQAQGKPPMRLSTETIKLFQKYRWPGNIRELQNVLEQIVLLCDDDIVEPSSLPEDFLRRSSGGGKALWQSLEQLARQMVEGGGYSDTNPLMPQIEALLASKMTEHADNKGKAASLLGITRPTLYARLRGYNRLK